MLSEYHLTTTPNDFQHQDEGYSDDFENRPVARQLLTSETNIFDVGSPSPLDNIIEDILAGSDQLYSTLSPYHTSYDPDSDSDTERDLGDDSDSSEAETPPLRRKDSIMTSDKTRVSSEADQQDAVQQKGTAAQRVLGMYELLEQILLEAATSTEEKEFLKNVTGLKTALLAQRVDKTFQHIIQRSTKLQQKLFFKYKVSERTHPSRITWNPLLEHPALASFATADFCDKVAVSGYVRMEPAQGYALPTTLSLPTFYRSRGKTGAQRPSYESWRRMLVCQGEALDLQLKITPKAPAGWAWKCDELVAGTRTTMGEVWDKIFLNREWTLQ